MRHFFIYALTLLIIVVLISCSRVDFVDSETNSNTDNHQEIVTKKVISIVGEDGYRPISYMEDGEVKGISPDIIREAFKRMDIEIKLELQPWKRAQKSVEEGEIDGIFSPYFTEHRNEIYLFTKEPLLIEKNVLIVKKDSDIAFDGNLETLKEYTFATMLGYATLEEYIESGLIANIEYSTTVDNALLKLVNRDGIDILVNTNFILWDSIYRLGLEKEVKELSPSLSDFPAYLAFTRKKDLNDLADNFDKILKEMKKDGTYDKILKKYIN